MHVLFCAEPFAPRTPDPAYAREVAAAARLGLEYALLDFERLVNDGDAAGAVRGVPTLGVAQPAVYRGWMLTPAQYGRLYAALLAKGWRLINDPAAYRHCHYLPESLEIIAAHTPRTIWLPLDGPPDWPDLLARLAVFGSAPLILKDYVKSRKHDWATACFIPAADDAAQVRSVVERFIALQGDELNEGLVFREFVAFQPLAEHPKSGMPLTKEYRAFWADGRPLYLTPYWDGVEYDQAAPPLDEFAELAGRVRSRFWTMDLAQRPDGDWMIVELGDGQVAGLPDHADPAALLAALAAHLA